MLKINQWTVSFLLSLCLALLKNVCISAEFTSNQLNTLKQLNSIIIPTYEESLILAELPTLSIPDLQHSLNQLSGEQFTSLAVANQLTGNHFLRSLYNPIRLTVIKSPIPYTCCFCPTTAVWMQGSGGQSFINNCKHANHTVASGYHASLGAQIICDRDWTFGIAASYSENRLDYRTDGSGRGHYGFAGLYGLYRPIGYYALADLVYGASRNRLTRQINVNDLSYQAFSKPNAKQILGYIEVGMDCPLWDLLVQPFLGIEVNGVLCNRISENGDSPLNLMISGHNTGNVYSRLGAHITLDQCYFIISLDAAWKCRLNSANNKIACRFQSFGEEFHVKDVKRGQSFFEGALSATATLCHNFDVYAEASGFVGYHSQAYQGLIGIKYNW